MLYHDSLDKLGQCLDQINKNLLIISHPEIKKLYGSKLEKFLTHAGCTVSWTLIPAGEKHKNLEILNKLYDACASKKIDKNSCLVAFGGGVVQDMVCYLAATYKRGVPYVQIPTTLLAQADIGIGGCAIDHSAGKSLIGAFYQPKWVYSDIKLVKSLSDEEYANGIAEIINKVGCLDGKIEELEKNLAQIKERNYAVLEDYVMKSVIIKKAIIMQDETGTKGPRLFLDWGHTITYALEKALDYEISHGQALGIGMYGAALLSHQEGYLEKEKVERLKRLIQSAGLPTRLPKEIDIENLIELMKLDQKVVGGNIRFVLLRDFGKPFLSSVDDATLKVVLQELK
jgi:3-dehydroquinate synthase